MGVAVVTDRHGALALEQRAPERRFVRARRRDHADAGYRDASALPIVPRHGRRLL
jgi:hypothetical protein